MFSALTRRGTASGRPGGLVGPRRPTSVGRAPRPLRHQGGRLEGVARFAPIAAKPRTPAPGARRMKTASLEASVALSTPVEETPAACVHGLGEQEEMLQPPLRERGAGLVALRIHDAFQCLVVVERHALQPSHERVGVNGAGKTTSIAKLANHLKQRGNSVLLGAGDTFRAAAVEQLTLWSERLGIEIVKQDTGADPAAVAFDATAAAIARKVDYLILDTAGRLHTQKNLMTELEKIVRVVKKQLPDAPHETLLVLDGTTGQNAIRQASEFQKSAPVTGLILAKMDGTAKGGALFGIREVLPVPVKFLGVGEGIDDLEKFVVQDYVDAILRFDTEAGE